MSMKYIAIALSEVGKIRKNNEDNLFFDGEFRDSAESMSSFRKTLSSQDPIKLFALCDGMGGEAMGEQASYMAVSGLKEIELHFKQDKGKSFPKLMPRYLARVNESLCQTIRKNKGLRMGSTFASLIIRSNVAQAMNIGDSRIYLFRNGKLSQLSVDHTYAQRLVEMGIITQEEAVRHPERNRLSQHLGLFPEEAKIQPALSPEIWLQAGDSFLICTDGVTEMVPEASITEILRSPQAFLQQAENLMQRALTAGGKDNISLILIKIQEMDDENDELDIPVSAALAAPFVVENVNQAASEAPKGEKTESNILKSDQSPPAADTEQTALEGESSDATKPIPVVAPIVPVVVEAEARQGAAYALNETEIARFEEARRAALERQQALKGDNVLANGTKNAAMNGKLGQGLQNAGASKSGVDPRNRKLRGPSTGHIIGRAILIFLIFAALGFALIFAMMNIDVLIRFVKKIIGM